MTTNARIWTVVKPTVGLPLFLGGVATIAVLVHLALLSHTTWYGGYWNGQPIGKKAAAVATVAAPEAAAPVAAN
jgi:light-harvesting protein B-800-850 alpha chain